MAHSHPLLVLDWNGTLLDDMEACMKANNKTLEYLGVPPSDRETYREKMVIPIIDYYIAMGCCPQRVTDNAREIANIFEHHYGADLPRTPLRKGAEVLLKTAQAEGYHCVVLSNHTKSCIGVQVKRLQIEEHFQFIIANDDGETVIHKRHKGEKLRFYMEEHGYCPTKTVIVGDTEEEPRIAHDLGATGIAVTGGYHSERRLREADPHHLVNCLSEIPALLERVAQ